MTIAEKLLRAKEDLDNVYAKGFNNGVASCVTDLTGTTWKVFAGWSVDAGYGMFNIDASLTTYSETGSVATSDLLINQFLLGYKTNGTAIADIVSNSIVYRMSSNSARSYIEPEFAFDITINSGTSVTDTKLITWLATHGKLISGGTNNSSSNPILYGTYMLSTSPSFTRPSANITQELDGCEAYAWFYDGSVYEYHQIYNVGIFSSGLVSIYYDEDGAYSIDYSSSSGWAPYKEEDFEFPNDDNRWQILDFKQPVEVSQDFYDLFVKIVDCNGSQTPYDVGYENGGGGETVPTVTQATPSITVSTSGLITASATQTEGYVVAGTKSATKQLTTQAARTITPTTSNQTAVANGVYTTGAITVKGDANLVAENIKSGVSIFGVEGSYESSSSRTQILYGTYILNPNPQQFQLEENITVDLSGTLSKTWFYNGNDYEYSSIDNIEFCDDGIVYMEKDRDGTLYLEFDTTQWLTCFEDEYFQLPQDDRWRIIDICSPVEVSQDVYNLFMAIIEHDPDVKAYDIGYNVGITTNGGGSGSSEDLEALGALCDWQVVTVSSTPTVVITNYHPSYYLHCDICHSDEGEIHSMVVFPDDLESYTFDGYAMSNAEITVENVRWSVNA